MADNTSAAAKRQEGQVPDIVIGRLPLYLRALILLEKEGKEVTSSQELGKRLGISSAQIRKDLSHFGEFGKQGTGYAVSYLKGQLKEILNLDGVWSVALIGFGDLGHALLHYNRFSERRFNIELIFDADPDKIGHVINGIIIQNVEKVEEVIKAKGIQIAILAVPIEVAQTVTDKLVNAGVRAILNYAPITLKNIPQDVKVQTIDPIAHLQKMTYYLG